MDYNQQIHTQSDLDMVGIDGGMMSDHMDMNEHMEMPVSHWHEVWRFGDDQNRLCTSLTYDDCQELLWTGFDNGKISSFGVNIEDGSLYPYSSFRVTSAMRNKPQHNIVQPHSRCVM
jgi:hypothetical protein